MLGSKRNFSEQKTERFCVSMPSDVLAMLKDEARRVCLTVPQLVVTEAVRAVRERRERERLQDMINKQHDTVNKQAEMAPALFQAVNEANALVNTVAEQMKAEDEPRKTSRVAKKTNNKRRAKKEGKK